MFIRRAIAADSVGIRVSPQQMLLVGVRSESIWMPPRPSSGAGRPVWPRSPAATNAARLSASDG